ncbi:hypothetical protein [Desulfocastanea catecholica]
MIKRKLVVTALITVALTLMLGSSFAHAEDLKFGWDYPPEEVENIDGFRLYRDGNIIDTDAIPKTALTITVPRQTDKQDHTYHLVAYVGTMESGPSQATIDSYNYTINAVGSLTIEVIK